VNIEESVGCIQGRSRPLNVDVFEDYASALQFDAIFIQDLHGHAQVLVEVEFGTVGIEDWIIKLQTSDSVKKFDGQRMLRAYDASVEA
jgi:hypothetical protein